MKNIVISVCLFALLGACAQVEMPKDAEGVDQMRVSPCACNQLDYEGAKFKWRG